MPSHRRLIQAAHVAATLLVSSPLAVLPAAVHAQDRATAYDRARSDEDYALKGDNADGGVPYAGRYLGYDYVRDEYYRWDGSEPAPPQAREQDGYRNGVLHTRPAGYGYGYRWRRYDLCGCGRYSYYRVYTGFGDHTYVQLDPRRAPYR